VLTEEDILAKERAWVEQELKLYRHGFAGSAPDIAPLLSLFDFPRDHDDDDGLNNSLSSVAELHRRRRRQQEKHQHQPHRHQQQQPPREDGDEAPEDETQQRLRGYSINNAFPL